MIYGNDWRQLRIAKSMLPAPCVIKAKSSLTLPTVPGQSHFKVSVICCDAEIRNLPFKEGVSDAVDVSQNAPQAVLPISLLASQYFSSL